MDGHTDEAVAILLLHELHTYDATRTPSATRTCHLLDKHLLNEVLEDGHASAIGFLAGGLVLLTIHLGDGQRHRIGAHRGSGRQHHRHCRRARTRQGIVRLGQINMIFVRCLIVHRDGIIKVLERLTKTVESHIDGLRLSQTYTVGTKVLGRDRVLRCTIGLYDQLDSHRTVVATEVVPLLTSGTSGGVGNLAINIEVALRTSSIDSNRAVGAGLRIFEGRDHGLPLVRQRELLVLGEHHRVPSWLLILGIHCHKLRVGALLIDAIDRDTRRGTIAAEGKAHTDHLGAYVLHIVVGHKIGTSLHLARRTRETERVVNIIRGIVAHQSLVGLQGPLCRNREGD